MHKPSKIFWRPEIESFFAEFPERSVRSLIDNELRRHGLGVQKGKILSHGEFFEHHMEQVKRKGGVFEIRPKASSAGFSSDIDSLQLLDEKLRELLGNWIPGAFSYHALHPKFWGTDRFIALPNRRQQKEARELIIEALKSRQSLLNTALTQLHLAHRSKSDPHPDPLTPSPSPPDESGLQRAIRRLVEDKLESSNSEDRWFFLVADLGSLYLESVGCEITLDEIDDIAEGFFQSWMEPSQDDIQRFADELAALSVKQLFDHHYGS